ncbi:MAG: hypothetical protein ACRDUY_10365 [Nitriliruptorales bacterium]
MDTRGAGSPAAGTWWVSATSNAALPLRDVPPMAPVTETSQMPGRSKSAVVSYTPAASGSPWSWGEAASPGACSCDAGSPSTTGRRVADALASRAAVADSQQTWACAWLSAVVLVGLVLNAALGWWSADPIAALGVVVLLVREGREALVAEHVDHCWG